MTEDFSFTSVDLVDGKLAIPDTRIVEFSIENENGELVLLPRLYSDYENKTIVDFSMIDVQGTWHIRKIPVEKGEDAEPGIPLDEYLVQLYLLRDNGKYLPHVGDAPAFPLEQEKNAPLLSKKFYASGTDQFVSEEVVQAIIPCKGEMRQYVGTAEIYSGVEGILYQFQVFRGDTVLYDVTQDSLVYPENYMHHGNDFYFPELLPARPSEGEEKYTYYWRVRASYKIKNPDGELYWSGWSKQFPFIVNTPPPVPYELSVSASNS